MNGGPWQSLNHDHSQSRDQLHEVCARHRQVCVPVLERCSQGPVSAFERKKTSVIFHEAENLNRYMHKLTSLVPLAFYLRPPRIYTPGWRTRMPSKGRDQEYRTVEIISELTLNLTQEKFSLLFSLHDRHRRLYFFSVFGMAFLTRQAARLLEPQAKE